MSATGLNDVLQYIAYGFPLSAVRLVPSAAACCGFNGVRKKKRMRRTTKAPVGAKAARSGKKWSPGLCMARRGYQYIRVCPVTLSACCAGSVQFAATPQLRSVAEILGRGDEIAGGVHQLGAAGAHDMGFCLLYTSPSPRD